MQRGNGIAPRFRIKERLIAMGQTVLTAVQQTALAPVLAANWH